MQGEVEFVRFLADYGIAVARPLPSQKGNFLEIVSASDDSYFIAVGFEKIEGELPVQHWNETLFEKWGEVTAQIHVATQLFIPSAAHTSRIHWHQDVHVYDLDRLIPNDEGYVKDQAARIVKRIKRLPEAPNAYGLIHTDIHQGNFLRKPSGELGVFDFDDAAHKWFASDIAIAIYYASMHTQNTQPDKDVNDFAAHFFEHYWKGYSKIYTLDAYWLKQIPDFLKLRDLTLYTCLHQKWDIAELNAKQHHFLDSLRNRIVMEKAIVELK